VDIHVVMVDIHVVMVDIHVVMAEIIGFSDGREGVEADPIIMASEYGPDYLHCFIQGRLSREEREMNENPEERLEREIDELAGEVRDLEERLASARARHDEFEAGLREALASEFLEVVAFARDRGHAWVGKRFPIAHPSGSGFPADDEELAETLADVFAARETGESRREIDAIERELRDKRKQHKKKVETLKTSREMFG
jgi:hypothetical protein